MTTVWKRAVHSVNLLTESLFVICLVVISVHYGNTPMQHTAIFHGYKNDNFQLKYFVYFHIFAQNIDCGYTLEPPQEAVLTSTHNLCFRAKI